MKTEESREYARKRAAPAKRPLPTYYHFVKYFILLCIEVFIVLLLAWLFPTEKILFLLKEFFPFLVLVAVFLYLYFLVIEYETRKHLQAKRELEERNADLHLLAITSHKIFENFNFRKRVCDGFAGLACLLEVKKGFALLGPDNENREVAVAYHLNRKTAEVIGSRLKEKETAVPEKNAPLLNPKKDRFPAGETSEIPGWKNPQIISLRTEKRSMGFLVLDAEISDEKKETVELLCRQLAAALENSLLHQEVEKFSITDPLTGLYNLRFFHRRLSEELDRAKRFYLPFSLMLSDIDNFKKYVDDNGHRLGDEALRKMGELAQSALRKIDFLARYGGDEFVYILPQTKAGDAAAVAQRVKHEIDRYSFPARNGFANLTLSFGITSFPDDARGEPGELIEKADQALFRAKSRGKNQVCLWKD